MINFLFTKTPFLFFVQSFWRDEAFTFLLAKRNTLEILVLTAHDFNPPFYYLIIHFWMKIFGSSEIALRSFSFIMYWATIYVSYLFLTKILKINYKKAFLYLIFFIINPVLLYYAFEARMYTLLAFLATLSFYSFYKKDKGIYLISTILGLYTHYFMIFVVLAQIAYSRRLIKLNFFASLFLIPWVIFVLMVKGITNESFWIDKVTFNTFVQLLGIIYIGYERDFNFYEKAITWLSLALLALIGLALVTVKNETVKEKQLFLYLIFWGIVIPLVVAVISLVKPIFLPRYFIFSTVGFLILLVFILERLNKFFISRVIASLLVSGIIASALSYQAVQVLARKKSDLRRIVKEIKTVAGKNDVLYVTNELNFFVAEYYFDENRVFIYGKTYQEIPDYVGKVLTPREKVINTLPHYPNKAFILTSDTHYDIQAAY